MDFKAWIDNVEGMAGIYSFDILPDGSFSEIRLMAVNTQNEVLFTSNPNVKFYPGIPYREYWTDINFEDYVYTSCTTNQQMYIYVNAHGFWLKGFYIPITEPGSKSAVVAEQRETGTKRTMYCLYIFNFCPNVDSDAMSQHSADVLATVMNISLKLHETQDYYQAMAATVSEIKKFCGAEQCAIYTVDLNSQRCALINENGIQEDFLNEMASEMERTPYEVALAWEKDLVGSDCLLLDNLSVVKDRDPVWYKSLIEHDIKNIILYSVRNNQTLVGFIWAANYDISKMMQIRETLELTIYLIAAVISNHQLVDRLKIMSNMDGLTQVNSRNALNERVENLVSGKDQLPDVMGVVFADLNGLKNVNDDEGHDAGDKLLSKAASLLKIAFGDYEIYRAGGDEFVILCPDITEEKLNKQVSQLRSLMERAPDVSFAIGTTYVSGEYDINRTMQIADEQMYMDKEEYYRLHPEKDRRNR